MSPPMTIPDGFLRTGGGLLLPAEAKDPRSEGLKVTGNWKFELYGPDGKLKDVREKKNLITAAGFQLISDCLFIQSGRPAVGSYLAVGTGVTAAAIGDTALQTESIRQVAAYSYAAKVATLSSTFAAGVATGALTEAGVLNAASVGLLLNHVIYAVINKGALDILTSTFTFTLS
jgi:hypothetical protein